ncbi:MAG TPA: heme ABC transporter permease CcmC [Candidatus Tectomicrobia bacterium]|nr:heme ABC transporter permease CcmC [Candidatus Tectomicrobia bacterium]
MIGRLLANGLGIVALLAVMVGLYLAFFYAPPDALQGDVQRIMYVHVPTAWVAFFAFFVVFLASIVYLWKRLPEADRLAYASAEIGVLFTALTLIDGSIWGKPTWGTWWTWDARLTTTAILFVIYVGYLMLRSFIDEPDRRARLSALVGIVGFIDVPIIYMSVLWFRTLHQPPSIQRGGASMPDAMLFTLLFNFGAYTLVYLFFLVKRVRIESLQAILDTLSVEKAIRD